MAEGLNKAIELKGIARNTAPSTCQDGELEEIINLRFKDGSWKPVGELEDMGSVGQHTELYVHTNLYHHLLGVEGGALYWFANVEDGKVVNLDVPVEIAKVTGEVSIKQTGHLITIIDSEGLTYSLFNTQKDEYVTINADFNGKQTDTSLIPEGLIDFRVTAEVDEYGRTLYGTVREQLDVSFFEDVEKGNYDKTKIPQEAHKIASSIFPKAFHIAKQENFFAEGYFLLCTALQLYDGNYILQSRPILMAPPYISRRLQDQYTPITSLNPLVFDEKYCTNANFVDWNDEITLEDCKFDESKSQSYIINRFDSYNQEKRNDYYGDFSDMYYAKIRTYKYKWSDSASRDAYIWLEGARPIHEMLSVQIKYNPNYNCELHIALNKLQVRFNNKINSAYKDIIKNVSVFITPQIGRLDLENAAQYVYTEGEKSYNIFESKEMRWYNQIYSPEKSAEDIIKEINKLTTFYKIAECNIEEINPSKDWIDLKIDKGILSVLTEQERLTIDNFSRNSHVPKTTFSYNGRLHLANYTSDMFRGFPLNYFFGHNAEGQWNVETGSVSSEGLPYSTYIAVEIETSEGVSKVVRYTPANYQGLDMIYDLNPIISYPDSRAKKITIVVNDGRNETAWKSEFELAPHPYFNFAYYIDPNLKPINLFQYEGSQSPLPSEVATQENKNNCVKVSSVDNPFYFPVANTYQIGNSEIIGFATNTIALSTGQAGDAPLYVFTKDGIYALFVDASGQLTYTNSRPIARDICNNPKSITPIDDGVLFTTDRGLMLLSGSEVIDMSDIAEGVPFDLTSVSEIDACVNHPQLVQLKSNTSKENFLEYIKGAVIGYNYFDKEIWISNPAKAYSYVYNIRVKGWTKRTESAEELVGDYPYVYMLGKGQDLRNISKEIVGLTETMFLTRPIKLQTQEFKQGYRTILRSLLETEGSNYCGVYLFGSYDCRKWALIGARERDGVIRDLGLLSHRVDCKYFRLLFVGKLKEGSTIEYLEMSAEARLLADKIR